MNKEKLITIRNKVLKILKHNNVVLRNISRLVESQKNKVNINAWIDTASTHNNMGDYLSIVIVSEILKNYCVDINKTVSKTKHLYGVGSVLLGYQDATVWGSGFGYDISKYSFFKVEAFFHRLLHKTDIRAVRGPITKKILEDMGLPCPAVFGDPAILLPRFFQPNTTKRKPYVVVPHYSVYDSYKGKWPVVSTFSNDWKSVVSSICEAEVVISSSLHGIIIAEAYGIPAIMLADTPSEDITKYRDWYYSTGRSTFATVKSVEEALDIISAGLAPPPLEKIGSLAEGLLSAFPLDLWEVNI